MTHKADLERGDRKEAAAAETNVVLLRIVDGQAAHGRLLHIILELLTASRDGDGPNLAELLESLIQRIGAQTTALQALAQAVAKLGRELPADLVAAIEDNLGQVEQGDHGAANGSVPS